MPIFTNYEKRFLRGEYFELIKEQDRFIEFKSRNTQHCWILFRKSNNNLERPITIYHKHHQSDPYYHKHYEAYTIGQAIKSIKDHDSYVLRKKEESMNRYKRFRQMKVYEASVGPNYKRVPQIRLQGEWLEELSFEPGVKLSVECQGGKIVITRADEVLSD